MINIYSYKFLIDLCRFGNTLHYFYNVFVEFPKDSYFVLELFQLALSVESQLFKTDLHRSNR